MPFIKNAQGKTIYAHDMTQELLNSLTPVFPLKDTQVGVHFTSPISGFTYYVCVQHISWISSQFIQSPLTLQEATKQCAVCSYCDTCMFIPPDFPEWDTLTHRLLQGVYTQFPIYTECYKRTGTHDLFNYACLLPGETEQKLLSGTGDYSAKHIADRRRDEWPDYLYVHPTIFQEELIRRNAPYDLSLYDKDKKPY